MIIILIICAIACFSYGFSPSSKSNHTIQIDFKLAYEKQNTAYTSFINSRPKPSFEYKKIYIDFRGYPRYSNSYKLVHRCNMEAHLKRKLTKEEVVHHKDGDKRNFRFENLQLCANQDEHDKIHRNNLINTGWWYGNKPKYINTIKYA